MSCLFTESGICFYGLFHFYSYIGLILWYFYNAEAENIHLNKPVGMAEVQQLIWEKKHRTTV